MKNFFESLSKELAKNKNCQKVSGYCHYAGQYRSAAHSI